MQGEKDRPPVGANAAVDSATWRVRLRRGGLSGDGRVLGAGVLLGSDRVLTCAHVIFDPATRGRPERVIVEFPRPRGLPRPRIYEATVLDGHWLSGAEGARGDLALLALDGSAPQPSPVTLYCGVFPVSAPVELVGYPADLTGGHTLLGVCMGHGGPGDERDQIDLDRHDDSIVGGFSGGGVLMRGTDRVLGILSEKAPKSRGYMIPSATIVHYFNDLRAHASGGAVIPRGDVLEETVAGVTPVHGLQRTVVRWLDADPQAWDVETLSVHPADTWGQNALRLVLNMADRERSPRLTAAPGAGAPQPHGRGVPGLSEAGIRPRVGSIGLVLNLAHLSTDPPQSEPLRQALAGLDEALVHTQRSGVRPAVAVLGTEAHAVDPRTVARVLGERAERGTRLLLVFADGDHESLRAASALLPPDRAARWLERLGARIDELVRTEASVRKLYHDVEHHVVGDASPTAYGAQARLWAAQLAYDVRELGDRPAGPALLENLSRAEQATETHLLRAHRTLRALRAAHTTHLRLRGMLAAHQMRLVKHQLTEHPEAVGPYSEAQRMLFGANRLDDTAAAVKRFAKVVRRLVSHHPDEAPVVPAQAPPAEPVVPPGEAGGR